MSTTQEKTLIAPSLEPAIRQAHIRTKKTSVDRRVVLISALSIGLAFVATLIAQLLTRLIGLVTNLAFYGRLSLDFVAPGETPHWGPWIIGVPVLGGIIVGLMARYGSKAIRGHGIPEAMEQILLNESRIPFRMTFLKPISAAISIGTGGPFGAEGPIIATGGALGSALGQVLKITASERKTLLAAGAAAGMSATFGSPVSAVLLAVELLLFEFRASSLIPVALAAATAAGARIPFAGTAPVFAMPGLESLHGSAVAFYIAEGALIGVASVLITRLVYWIEDLFEHLPIHWMWWPALGGIVVGVVGYFEPKTLGVGYGNIEALLSNSLTAQAALALCLLKLISWSISLGSGTSGGTLAPLLTIGGGLGLTVGEAGQKLLPGLSIDPKIAALVGTAALFAGASRALLASIVFAFEITQQPFGLLPLLGGCSASYLISCALMENSIMTEKIVRRGTHVPSEYAPDFLGQARVGDFATRAVLTLPTRLTIAEVERLFDEDPRGYSHQGYPVLNEQGEIAGVITKKDILEYSNEPNRKLGDTLSRKPITVTEADSLRDAADLMTQQEVGRIPVVSADHPAKLVGIIGRSDLLRALRLQAPLITAPLEPPSSTFHARLNGPRPSDLGQGL